MKVREKYPCILGDFANIFNLKVNHTRNHENGENGRDENCELEIILQANI